MVPHLQEKLLPPRSFCVTSLIPETLSTKTTLHTHTATASQKSSSLNLLRPRSKHLCYSYLYRPAPLEMRSITRFLPAFSQNNKSIINYQSTTTYMADHSTACGCHQIVFKSIKIKPGFHQKQIVFLFCCFF